MISLLTESRTISIAEIAGISIISCCILLAIIYIIVMLQDRLNHRMYMENNRDEFPPTISIKKYRLCIRSIDRYLRQEIPDREFRSGYILPSGIANDIIEILKEYGYNEHRSRSAVLHGVYLEYNHNNGEISIM